MALPKGKLVLALVAITFISFVSAKQATQSHHQINHFLQPFNSPNSQEVIVPKYRARRMYAMCPPKFQRIGNECYYFSDYKESWLDAHFECKDRNSKLAEPINHADKRLRSYLVKNDKSQEEKWIGGMYNWERNQWQWGYNGKEMNYQAFGKLMPGSRSDLKFNCAVLSPDLKYRWSAKMCMEKHNFICEHRMPYVNEKRRQAVYAKWNETYPNEMANEVEVYISTDGQRITRKEFHRIVPAQTATRNSPKEVLRFGDQEPQQSQNQLRLENEVNPEYSAFNNPKEQQRPKKHGERSRQIPYSFGGNVDLFKKRRRSKQKLLNRTTTTTVAPIDDQNELSNDIPVISNALPKLTFLEEDQTDRVPEYHKARHHKHHNHHTHRTTTTSAPNSSTANSTTTTQTPIIVTESSAQADARKAMEIKKAKQKRLKEKLAKLTPEEIERFIEMKRKLAEVKKQKH